MVCDLPGPECSSNFVSIWNKGGTPLYVCKVYASTENPENVFSLNPSRSKFSDFIAQPGKKEKICVDARVNENYLPASYPLKLIILTCAGAYSINLDNTGKLSTTAYEQEKPGSGSIQKSASISFFFTEGIKGIKGHRDKLYLYSPENVQVFRLKENWNPDPVTRWDYPGVGRLSFRGGRAYVLQANVLSSLDTHEIHCPPLLSRIEVPISSDLLLFWRRLAVASEEGVLLFEMEDLRNPIELGVIRERGVSSLEKVGGALALCGVRETVALYGVGEREEIKSLGTYIVRHRLTGLHFGRDLTFALSPEGTGVQIYVVTENLKKGTVEVSEG